MALRPKTVLLAVIFLMLSVAFFVAARLVNIEWKNISNSRDDVRSTIMSEFERYENQGVLHTRGSSIGRGLTGIVMPGDRICLLLEVRSLESVNGWYKVTVRDQQITAANSGDAIDLREIDVSDNLDGQPFEAYISSRQQSANPFGRVPLSSNQFQPCVTIQFPQDESLWDSTIIVRIDAEVSYPVRTGRNNYRVARLEHDQEYSIAVAPKTILLAQQSLTTDFEELGSQVRELQNRETLLVVLMSAFIVGFVFSLLRLLMQIFLR